jgi:hypothetical protein
MISLIAAFLLFINDAGWGWWVAWSILAFGQFAKHLLVE